MNPGRACRRWPGRRARTRRSRAVRSPGRISRGLPAQPRAPRDRWRRRAPGARASSRRRAPRARTPSPTGPLRASPATSRSPRRRAGWRGSSRWPRRRARPGPPAARSRSRVARSRAATSGTSRLVSCSVQPYGYSMSCSIPSPTPTSAVDATRTSSPPDVVAERAEVAELLRAAVRGLARRAPPSPSSAATSTSRVDLHRVRLGPRPRAERELRLPRARRGDGPADLDAPARWHVDRAAVASPLDRRAPRRPPSPRPALPGMPLVRHDDPGVIVSPARRKRGSAGRSIERAARRHLRFAVRRSGRPCAAATAIDPERRQVVGQLEAHVRAPVAPGRTPAWNHAVARKSARIAVASAAALVPLVDAELPRRRAEDARQVRAALHGEDRQSCAAR